MNFSIFFKGFRYPILLILLFLPLFISAQSTLSTGSIAFVGYNADDDDDFAIVVLEDITNETIYFTDRDIDGTNGLESNNSEGTIQWMTGATTIPVGTIVIFNDVDNVSNTDYGVSHGSITNPDLGFLFSQDGDGIVAFIGTDVATPTTYLAGIQNEENPNDDLNVGFGDTTGLNLGCAFYTITRTASADGAVFITNLNNRNSYKDYLEDLKDIDNWQTETTNGGNAANMFSTLPPATLACTTPSITGIDKTICAGESVLLSNLINGTLEHTVRFGTTFGTYPNLITSMVSPSSHTTYFVLDSLNDSDCKDTAKIVISVNPVPTITANNVSIDLGQSVDLSTKVNQTATGTFEYGTTVANLSSLNNIVTPTTTTTYIIRDTIIATECAGKTTLTVSVNTPILPSNPEIVDPCSCSDPDNVRDRTGTVTLFHDYIEINNGGIGETWRLATIHNGKVLNIDGTPKAIGVNGGEILSDLGNGNYRIDFWHEPGIGFDATVQRISDGNQQRVGNSCNTTDCFVAQSMPTLSQWGLIILGLLILNISLYFIQKEKELFIE